MLNKAQYNPHHQLLRSKLPPLCKMKIKIHPDYKKKPQRETATIVSNSCHTLFLKITRWDCLRPPKSQNHQGKSAPHLILLFASESVFCHYGQIPYVRITSISGANNQYSLKKAETRVVPQTCFDKFFYSLG